MGAHAADDDDVAARFFQMWDRKFRAEKRTPQIRVDDELPVFSRGFLDTLGHMISRVVYEDVDPAEFLDGLVDQVLQSGKIRDVSADIYGVSAGRVQLIADLRTLGFISRNDHDCRTFGGKHPRDPFADTLART